MVKQIELKEIELEKNGKKEMFSYKKYIELILDTPIPGQGFSLGEVRLCNKIKRQIDSANGMLVLEEQQWRFLKKKLEDYRWGIPHTAIESFADSILQANQVDLPSSR